MPLNVPIQPSGRPHYGQNRRVTMTAPLQVIVFSFSLGADFEERILEEVDRLRGRGVLRLLDMIFVAISETGGTLIGEGFLAAESGLVVGAEIAAMEEAAAVIAEAHAAEADALLRTLAAGAEAAEAEAASERIQSAAAAAAVRALIAAGLVEEAAAHEAVTALIAARLIVDAADQAAAESIAEDLATISAADEVAAEATDEAGDKIRAASITVAEAQVLRYLPKPLPFSVIADKLGISRSAAKERAERLYKRLGVHSRADAVSRARALGLIRG